MGSSESKSIDSRPLTRAGDELLDDRSIGREACQTMLPGADNGENTDNCLIIVH
jgi:hypothetical protein